VLIIAELVHVVTIFYLFNSFFQDLTLTSAQMLAAFLHAVIFKNLIFCLHCYVQFFFNF